MTTQVKPLMKPKRNTRVLFDAIDTSRDFYFRSEAAAFWEPHGENGDLSNRAAGFGVRVNGLNFHSPEGLFQALKFPTDYRLQHELAKAGGDDALNMGNQSNGVRSDWDQVKLAAMRYTVAAKLRAHPEFADTLLDTGDLPIVEMSYRDSYWCAKPDPEQSVIIGRNATGKILTQLRDELQWWEFCPDQTVKAIMDDLPKGRLMINGRTATLRPRASTT